MMITNRSACTVWEKTSVNHTPVYVRHELGRVWWEDVRGQTNTGADPRQGSDSAFISIPAASLTGYIPKKDDRILPGSVDSSAPPPSALTVMSVRDCLHGSQAVQHVEVKAE